MSALSQGEKLVRLGVKSAVSSGEAAQGIVNTFKEFIDQTWAGFQEKFEDAGLGGWADFETWLTNNGVSSTRAINIRSKLDSKYSSFSSFSDKVSNTWSSYAELQQDFQSGTSFTGDGETDQGLPGAGMKIYEESGIGRNGQEIPAGGVEIFGTEIHFSQVDVYNQAGSELIQYSNVQVTDTTPVVGQEIEISAEATNPANTSNTGFALLVVDGDVKKDKQLELSANVTTTVTFTYTFTEAGTFPVWIGKADPVDVDVGYPQVDS